MNSYLLKNIISLVIINLIIVLGFQFSNQDNIYIIVGSIIYMCISIISSIIILRSIDVSQAKFNSVFFGFTFLQLILALIYIAIYLKNSGLSNKWAVISLVFQYFIFMGFEIQFILSKLRTNSKS